MWGWVFLSACHKAGMFNVLIIGYAVVYISLSALRTHLNCQGTSKPCRSFIILLTLRMFSLSWVPGICYDLRASWQTGLLQKGFLFVTLQNINVPIMAYNCQRGLPPDSCVVSLICSPVTCFLEFRFSYGITCKQVTICRPMPGGTWYGVERERVRGGKDEVANWGWGRCKGK